MEKQSVKCKVEDQNKYPDGSVASWLVAVNGSCEFWWPYLIPVGAEVVVTVKIK